MQTNSLNSYMHASRSSILRLISRWIGSFVFRNSLRVLYDVLTFDAFICLKFNHRELIINSAFIFEINYFVCAF